MSFTELVLKNRSYRRFYEHETVNIELLRELINLARITPSAANLQPLKFVLSSRPELNAGIFSTLNWAGYLQDWPGPEEGERPAAYIVILGDTEIAAKWSVDPGIVMQTMLLGAVERGLGGCMFGSIRREKLSLLLEIPERYEILNVVALGKPKETVVIEDAGDDGNIRYYRDDKQVHHVPKRTIEEMIINI